MSYEVAQTTEQWKPIPDYEGVYEASDCGRVRSVDRISKRSNGLTAKRSGKVRRQSKSSQGYLSLALCKDGIEKKHLVHRLVISAFRGPSTLDVDHINGDRADARLSNLRYCTTRENMTADNQKGRNKHGFFGVARSDAKSERYRAQAYINGKMTHLGSFGTPEDAAQAYGAAISQIK